LSLSAAAARANHLAGADFPSDRFFAYRLLSATPRLLHNPGAGGLHMELRGEQRIAAPREHVWALLNDPAVLRDCIPGCETLEGSAADGFAARVTTKIGPVKATFNGAVTLSNVNAPESYTISGEGKGGVAGFAKGGADVHLAAEGGVTVLTYVVNAQVGGKLAQLGSRLIDSTAKKLAEQFFTCFATKAGAGTGTQTAAAGAPGPDEHGPEGARLDTGELTLPGDDAAGSTATAAGSGESAIAAASPDRTVPPAATGASLAPDPVGQPAMEPIAAEPVIEPELAPPVTRDSDLMAANMDVIPISHGIAGGAVSPATAETLDPDTALDAAAREVEEEVEAKAAVGFLGGPTVWGLLVILALIVVYYFAR
jgi:carbon monoxide dehydrogenase subunit G